MSLSYSFVSYLIYINACKCPGYSSANISTIFILSTYRFTFNIYFIRTSSVKALFCRFYCVLFVALLVLYFHQLRIKRMLFFGVHLYMDKKFFLFDILISSNVYVQQEGI